MDWRIGLANNIYFSFCLESACLKRMLIDIERLSINY